MPSGLQLQNTIKAVLLKLHATSRVVQFRESIRTGGSDLLGVHGTVTVTLTPVTPQPAVEMITTEEIASSANTLLLPGDFLFTFDGSLSEDTFRGKQILYGDEILNIVHVEPYPFKGVIAGWGVVARTVKPRT